MRKNNILTFNGINLSDFGCYYDGSELFRKPRRDVESFSVVGRNGDLKIYQDRYSNINRPFDCFINGNFIQNYNNLINALSYDKGYHRLETTEEPDVFYMACFDDEIEPNPWQFNDKGQFTLNFNFKPQKWLKSGENAIFVDDTTSLINPTYQDALPLLLVDGTGTITINDSVLTLANNTSTTYIDCEIQDCYEGTINRNPDLTITNGFPVLHSGENTIEVDGCEINIIPRWWRL